MRNDYIDQIVAEVECWQRQIHRQPELGFNEFQTADFVASKLTDFGLVVDCDLVDTAVVGVLKRGSSDRTLMFRAELDALPITVASELPHTSEVPGVMHVFGHDAHTTMLLRAAKLLASKRCKSRAPAKLVPLKISLGETWVAEKDSQPK